MVYKWSGGEDPLIRNLDCSRGERSTEPLTDRGTSGEQPPVPRDQGRPVLTEPFLGFEPYLVQP
jgi:hypothetical protein